MPTIYERALDFIPEGAAVGLGSGRAAAEFIKLLGARVKAGFRVRGAVATSEASAKLAKELGIPLSSLEEVMPLDVAVDGADEWDPNLDLIKGQGRALVREKIVAAASRRLIILVGPGKAVRALGEKGKLPVEIIPLALPLCRQRLRDFGWEPVLWTVGGQPARTDNGNYILDCAIPAGQPIRNAAEVEASIRAVPGVVGTGLFLGTTDIVLVSDDQFTLVEERYRSS